MGEDPNGHKVVGEPRSSLPIIGNVSASSVTATGIWEAEFGLLDSQNPAQEGSYSVGSYKPDFGTGVFHGVQPRNWPSCDG